jgi:hypothetical protein
MLGPYDLGVTSCNVIMPVSSFVIMDEFFFQFVDDEHRNSRQRVLFYT